MDAMDYGSMGAFGALMGTYMIFWLIIGAIMLVAQWKIFTKAGKPGWAAIIPVYNIIILLEIINKPIWWIVMLIIPIINVVFLILMYIELAKVFGKDTGFAVGLILLSVIFFPILAFGPAEYQPSKLENPQV